jgi:hypothetical protein
LILVSRVGQSQPKPPQNSRELFLSPEFTGVAGVVETRPPVKIRAFLCPSHGAAVPQVPPPKNQREPLEAPNLLAIPLVPSIPPEKTKTHAKNSKPAFVLGTFVTVSATMPETPVTTGLAWIEGKRYPLLSGNNAYIKNHACL